MLCETIDNQHVNSSMSMCEKKDMASAMLLFKNLWGKKNHLECVSRAGTGGVLTFALAQDKVPFSENGREN